VAEGLDGERRAQPVRHGTFGVQGGQDRRVAAGVRDDGHAGMVLGRRPDHRRPADVDLLDEAVEVELAPQGALGGGGEGIEVDDHQLERLDPGRGQLLAVGGQPAIGQDPAVDPGVERLHAPVEHLREAGDGGHVGDRQARLAEGPGGPPRAHELEAAGDEAGGERDQAVLVGDRQEGPARRRERRPAHGRIDDDPPAVDPQGACQQQPDGLRQEPVLDRVEPLQEGGLVVGGEDRDGLGEEDRPAVERGVDKVHGDARDGRPGRERVADRMGARVRREERGMDVEDAAREGGPAGPGRRGA